MADKTRDAIMDASRELFNERGYNAASMSDIAHTVGISKGNLTYHFKHKEDIIKALLDDSMQTRTILDAPARSIDELDAIFAKMQQVITDNAYYFWHYAQLAQLSPEIDEIQHESSAHMLKVLRESLANLEAEGILSAEPDADVYDALAKQLLLACIYWIPFCDLQGIERGSFREHAWRILRPSLCQSPCIE